MKTYDWTYHESEDLGTEDPYYSLNGTTITIQVCCLIDPGEPEFSVDRLDDDGLISHHGQFRTFNEAVKTAEAL